jgi:hypothetical protein
MERSEPGDRTHRVDRRGRTTAKVEKLVDEFICRIDYAPASAYRVDDPAALPLALCRIADRADRTGCAWRAWVDGPTASMIVASAMAGAVAGRRTSSLHVEFYDGDARLVSQGVWIRRSARRWELAAL